jgi:membrane-associated phospholipid phosphatase
MAGPRDDPDLDWWKTYVPGAAGRRMLTVLVAALVGAVIVCWVAVAAFGGLPGDAASAAEVREHQLGWLVLGPAHALDWLGHPVPAAIALLVLAGLLWQRIGWRHALLLLAAAGANGITSVIKGIVDRSRPEASALTGASFPSGHTAWATAIFGLLAVLAVQRRRWGIAAMCLLVVSSMGPSRVLLGVHWLSDVVAGYAVGLVWLIVLLVVGIRWARADVESG